MLERPKEEGIDVAVILKPANLRYLSAFPSQIQPEVALIIERKGESSLTGSDYEVDRLVRESW